MLTSDLFLKNSRKLILVYEAKRSIVHQTPSGIRSKSTDALIAARLSIASSFLFFLLAIRVMFISLLIVGVVIYVFPTLKHVI